MVQSRGGLLSPALARARLRNALPWVTGRVLDFGCGEGLLAGHVPAADYLGVDISGPALDIARAAHPGHSFVDDPVAIGDRRFDTVAALAVIEHVPDPGAWLRWVAAHLTPAGRLVATTPHRRWEWVHGLTARIGLASREAQDEHNVLFDRAVMIDHLTGSGLSLTTYRRFLGGLNQLFIITPD